MLRRSRALPPSPFRRVNSSPEMIRASGMDPVSRVADAHYIPAERAAEAVAWLCTPYADPFLGDDLSIKIEEGRKLLGLAQLPECCPGAA